MLTSLIDLHLRQQKELLKNKQKILEIRGLWLIFQKK